ncbi:hypothetical protein BH11BAC1_BH11BAC1_23760 [soil metagenome]
MKKIMLSVFFLYRLVGFAQNLVPNGSFEDTIACPNGLTQISRATGWSSYRESPDYFNYCDSVGFGNAGVPENSWGYQYPRTGNAYSGIGTFNISYSNLREYMGIQLIEPLEIGKCYKISFYAVRAKSTQPYINIAANKIGVRFLNISFSNVLPEPIVNYADVYSDSVIVDTVNWVQISGSFIADSAYRYLSLGNFFNDSLTDKVAYDTLSQWAYYFVDDISVLEDTCSQELFNTVFPQFSIFPNPAFDRIIISGNGIQNISISDILGRKWLFKADAYASSNEISLGNLSTGVYLICIQTQLGFINKKIIIQKF